MRTTVTTPPATRTAASRARPGPSRRTGPTVVPAPARVPATRFDHACAALNRALAPRPAGGRTGRARHAGFTRAALVGQRVGRWTSSALIALTMVLLGILGPTGGSSAAYADPSGGSSGGLIGWIKGTVGMVACPFAKTDAPKPEPYRMGIDSLTPAYSPLLAAVQDGVGGTASGLANSPEASTAVTAYEWYGSSGLNWSWYTEDCWNTTIFLDADISNQIFNGVKVVVVTSIAMFQWASSPTLMSDFSKPLDCLVLGCNGAQGLKNSLFLGFLEPIIVLGALYMGWVGLGKKRTMEAAQSAIWMIATTIFALIFMSYPSLIANGASSVVSQITGAAMESITGMVATATGSSDRREHLGDPNPSPASDQSLCSLPSGAPDAGMREAACSMWQAMLYTPWASGQFGVSPGQPLVGDQNVRIGDKTLVNADLRVQMLDAGTIDHDEQLKWSDTLQKQNADEWQNLKDKAVKASWFQAWSGQGGSRIPVALVAFLAGCCVGLMVLLTSFSTVVLNLGMIMLILVSPIFLLVGVHPGFGRRIGLKWLELLLSTIFKRVLMGIILAALIGIYQIIMSAPLGWWSQMVMVIGVTVGMLMYRKPILEAFNIVNLGGSTSGLESRRSGGAGAARAGKRGAGAIAGGIAGGGQSAGSGGSWLSGALAGAMLGGRSGSPLRAATMGSAAGRRVGGRAATAAAKAAKSAAASSSASGMPGQPGQPVDQDDPFSYAAQVDKRAREDRKLQDLVDRAAADGDPELARRLAAHAARTGRDLPPPRPQAPEGQGGRSGRPGSPGSPGAPGTPAAGSVPAPPVRTDGPPEGPVKPPEVSATGDHGWQVRGPAPTSASQTGATGQTRAPGAIARPAPVRRPVAAAPAQRPPTAPPRPPSSG